MTTYHLTSNQQKEDPFRREAGTQAFQTVSEQKDKMNNMPMNSSPLRSRSWLEFWTNIHTKIIIWEHQADWISPLIYCYVQKSSFVPLSKRPWSCDDAIEVLMFFLLLLRTNLCSMHAPYAKLWHLAWSLCASSVWKMGHKTSEAGQCNRQTGIGRTCLYVQYIWVQYIIIRHLFFCYICF